VKADLSSLVNKIRDKVKSIFKVKAVVKVKLVAPAQCSPVHRRLDHDDANASRDYGAGRFNFVVDDVTSWSRDDNLDATSASGWGCWRGVRPAVCGRCLGEWFR